jgi:signal transduction histidine kinase
VVHGLAGHQGPVEVRVTVHAAREMLTLRVSNTIAENKTIRQEGIGIKNVRERLAVQFEGRAALNTGPHGTLWISEITMPELLDTPERVGARRATALAEAS